MGCAGGDLGGEGLTGHRGVRRQSARCGVTPDIWNRGVTLSMDSFLCGLTSLFSPTALSLLFLVASVETLHYFGLHLKFVVVSIAWAGLKLSFVLFMSKEAMNSVTGNV